MLFFTYCKEEPTEPSNQNFSLSKSSVVTTDSETEMDLRDFAKSLAGIIKDDEVLRNLHEEIGKKFDGDPETIFKLLKNKTFKDKSTFESKLISKSNKQISRDLNKIINDLEKKININFFMPFYDKWNGTDIPLIAYYPCTQNDTEIKELNAFDKNGNEVVIKLSNAEKYQYILIGINERTETDGKLKKDMIFGNSNNVGTMLLPPDDGGGGGGGGFVTPRTDGGWEMMSKLQILDDQEPYLTNGTPEIRIEFKSVKGGVSERFYYDNEFDGAWVWFSHVDDTGWHDLNQNIIQWYKNDYGPILQVLVWEEDYGGTGQELSASLSYKDETTGLNTTVTLKFNIGTSDDQMGMRSIYYEHGRGEIYGSGYWNMEMWF